MPPIFPVPVNDKRSLRTKSPEWYYMAQPVGPFSSLFLKQNASLISDEIEVVQQARGIFWGVRKLLHISKVLCSTRSQIFIFCGTAWHDKLVRKLHRSPNCLHANTVSFSSLSWTYGWKLEGKNTGRIRRLTGGVVNDFAGGS